MKFLNNIFLARWTEKQSSEFSQFLFTKIAFWFYHNILWAGRGSSATLGSSSQAFGLDTNSFVLFANKT